MEEKLKSSWRCVGKVVKQDRKNPFFFPSNLGENLKGLLEILFKYW